jgi:hypothetical protein
LDDPALGSAAMEAAKIIDLDGHLDLTFNTESSDDYRSGFLLHAAKRAIGEAKTKGKRSAG